MNYTQRLESVAKAEDTYDLLNHIAWTDVIKPALDEQLKQWSAMLVAEALGTPNPAGLTRAVSYTHLTLPTNREV